MSSYSSRPHQAGARSITLAAIANDLAYDHGTPRARVYAAAEHVEPGRTAYTPETADRIAAHALRRTR
jgi:hypothetical protein